MKTYLGIKIEDLNIKMAICQEGQLKKMVIEPLAEDLVKEGIIQDWDKIGKEIKQILRKNRIKCKNVALVLPDHIVYSRRLTMAYMTIHQLQFNLSYEFRDFITEDKEKYFYDYAVMEIMEEEVLGQTKKTMDIMAVAVLKETIEAYRNMLKKSGLRLKIAAPELSAYQNIVTRYTKEHATEKVVDYAILSFKSNSVNLRIFTEGKFETGREFESNLNQISMDTVREDILYSDESKLIYAQIALEVMRIINFFNYNNPNNTLDTIYCSGKGADIEPLMQEIEETVGLKVKKISDLFENTSVDDSAIVHGAAAIGIAWI